MQQLEPSEVAFYRSVKRIAVILLLMIRLDRPASAREIAEIIDADYETTRHNLAKLARLGAITETRAGWILTAGGSQLVLPANADSAPSSSATASDSLHLPIAEEEEEEDLKRGKTASRELDALEALEDYAISATDQVLKLVQENSYITADYIHAQAARLTREQKLSTGLLLTVLRCHDPIPLAERTQTPEERRRKYTTGRYSEYID